MQLGSTVWGLVTRLLAGRGAGPKPGEALGYLPRLSSSRAASDAAPATASGP